MGYYHIDNLYKAQEILSFKTCYALEKIHGTSAHIRWCEGKISYFSGGVPHDQFVELFDTDAIAAKVAERFTVLDDVTVFGEAYGGKCQGMSPTYGKSLKFIAFDVKVGDAWLSVPQAVECVAHLGLEFVDFTEVPTDIAALDAERDKPSTQAIRNGIMEPKIREGIVLRPPYEVMTNNGRRVIAKHKREEFAERCQPRVNLDSTKHQVLEEAAVIALEWVTPTRLEHVIDTVVSQRDDKTIAMQDIPTVIRAMLEDVQREAAGEIIDSQAARKAIGHRTVLLFKRYLEEVLRQ